MGYFPVRYNSRVVIYERKMFIRLGTDLCSESKVTWLIVCKTLLSTQKHLFVFKISHSWSLFLSFHHFWTVNRKYDHFKIWPMTDFESRTSSVGSNRSANWATAPDRQAFVLILENFLNDCRHSKFKRPRPRNEKSFLYFLRNLTSKLCRL